MTQKNLDMRAVYFLVLLVVTLGVSCKKYETEPVDLLTDDYVYDKMDDNGDYARQVMNHLYVYLPNGFNRIDHVVLATATDDAIASERYSNMEVLSMSRMNPLSESPDGYWYPGYEAIRNINLFLAHIDVVPVDPLLKQYWKAEARFIRAMNYFELIKRYGGVPLVGDQLFPQEARPDIARSSYAECVAYIVKELDAIQDSLRPDPVADVEIGRITKGADLALKSRVLLYAASPLNNPEHESAKWQAASDAAYAVIAYNKFTLSDDFNTLFVDRTNPEVILAYQRGITSDLERDNAPVGYGEPNQSNGYVSPTQELVDAFPMINGRSIEDHASGYDEQHPYDNRDPRFYATVFYNGAPWLGRNVQTFEGGLDKPNTIQRQTRTGYYMRKFLVDYSDKDAYGNSDHNFIIFRYGGILLNYAEAENELGHVDVAYAQLIALRKRAGIEAGDDGLYGLQPAMDQVAMRKAIHHERRIEMAFEEQRFWDERRWKTAETDFNRTLHGIRITRATDETFTYERTSVQEIVFKAPQMYRYPIPYNEVASNPSMEQNEAWQ